MKVWKTLLIIILLPVLVYAGLKGYVYYQAREVVKTFIAQVAPFVKVEYRGIGSTLPSGTVQVEGLTFQPNGIADTVSVRAITLSAGGLRALLKLVRQAEDKQIPDSFGVGLHGVSISLDGALMRMADRFMSAAATAAGAASVPHCGNQPTAGIAFMRRLGYETITFDLKMNYDLNKSAQLLAMNIETDIQQMNRFTVNMKLSGMQPGIPNLKAPPSVKEFSVLYKDLSYKDRLKRYCMQTAKISEADYLKAEIEGGMFYRQMGILPGPGLQEAYREFLAKPESEVRLRAFPGEGFDPKAMAFYQPSDVLRLLNASITVNNKPIEDLSFTFGVPAALAAAKEPSPEMAGAKESQQPEMRQSSLPGDVRMAQPPISKEIDDGFRAIQVADLGRYLNRTVRLRERGQQSREGVLANVGGGVATIERRYASGSLLIKIPLDKIDKAEVEQ